VVAAGEQSRGSVTRGRKVGLDGVDNNAEELGIPSEGGGVAVKEDASETLERGPWASDLPSEEGLKNNHSREVLGDQGEKGGA
jgi:hypothetical protein